jgi:phage shock protein A
MGLYKRIHRVTIGRISALLERVEDPEIVLPQLLREMEQQVGKATAQEASAAAAVKRLEVHIERTRERIDSLGRGAAQAMKQGREDVAREALGAQIDAEGELANLDATLASLQASHQSAVASRRQVQQQFDELRARKQALLTRAALARTRQNIQQSVGGTTVSGESILDAVARLEERVEEAEAQVEVGSRLAGDGRIGPSLAYSLAQLDQQEKIEQRLAQLKAGSAAESGVARQ